MAHYDVIIIGSGAGDHLLDRMGVPRSAAAVSAGVES
jgi:hypothetical protein